MAQGRLLPHFFESIGTTLVQRHSCTRNTNNGKTSGCSVVLDSEDGSNSQRIAAHEMLNLFSYGDSDGDDDSSESFQGVWIDE